MAQDPLQLRAQADAVMQRTADQLRTILETAAGQIDPFPTFPGTMFSNGIEVQGVGGSERGCVVVGEDGGLYELQIGVDADQLALGVSDPASTRHELRIPIEDLAPAEYASYAYNAIVALTNYAEQQPQQP
ncbi:MAG: hypothetical protein R3C39_07645 [Dehalococcoidia bacterium]